MCVATWNYRLVQYAEALKKREWHINNEHTGALWCYKDYDKVQVRSTASGFEGNWFSIFFSDSSVSEKGKGFGTLSLLERMDAATEAGFKAAVCIVADTNVPQRKLLAHQGWVRTPLYEGISIWKKELQ